MDEYFPMCYSDEILDVPLLDLHLGHLVDHLIAYNAAFASRWPLTRVDRLGSLTV